MSMPGEFVGKEPGSKIWLRFLGVNPRHHSLAFLPMPNPSKCVHIMLEVDKLDHVGRALERVKKHKAPLSATLGRHMNDEMVSFYVQVARWLRHRVRHRRACTVEDERWVARESTAVSYWGHNFGGGQLGPSVDTVSSAEIPEGMKQDARETWPSHDLIESWLGDSMYDFQLRPGEDVVVDADDPEAVAAARLFRDVLGRFASGVTVVTAISGGEPGRADLPVVLQRLAQPAAGDLHPGQDLAGLADDPALRSLLRELPRRRPGRPLQPDGQPQRRQVRRRRVDAQRRDRLAGPRGDARLRRLPDPRRARGR